MRETTSQPVTEAVALRRLENLCAKSEHSAGEMVDKMRQWHLSEEAQARIMETLTKGRYVDDKRFTEAFVHDKITFNGWGRRKIEQALWQKHVDERVYKPILDDMDEEEYLVSLRPLVRQKYRSIKAKSEYERAMKLIKYAVGRGFSIEQVRQCIDELAEELGDADGDVDDF